MTNGCWIRKPTGGIFDRVFNRDFWHTLSVERSYLTGRPAQYSLDPDRLIAAPEAEMVHFSEDEVRRAAQTGRGLRDPATKRFAHVRQGSSRYLWHAPRLGGVWKGRLEELPTYSIVANG
jgi:hypothetical protein